MRTYKNEAAVKKRVKEVLKSLNIWYFMPQAGKFGTSGIPDLICCKKGLFIGIETKFGSNKTTDIQDAQLDRIQMAGGVTMVVNEHNIELMEKWLSDL